MTHPFALWLLAADLLATCPLNSFQGELCGTPGTNTPIPKCRSGYTLVVDASGKPMCAKLPLEKPE